MDFGLWTSFAIAPETLDRIAWVLLLVGFGVFSLALVWHWRRDGTDLFRGVPVRGSRITPLPVILPFCGFVLASAFLQPLAQSVEEGATREAVRLGVNSLAQVVGGILCLWIGARCFRGGLCGFVLGRRGWLRPVAIAVLYLLVAGSLCESAAYVTKWLVCLFRPEHVFTEHDVIESLNDPASPIWASLALWVGAVVVAPVAEECFFRGLVQTVLLRTLRMRWVAVLLSAALFGLAHVNQPHVVPALILFGVILGVQYERGGGLVGPIALHAMFNLKTLVWQWLLTGAGGT